MPSLLETLVVELERPRDLPGQVASHLETHYGIEREAIGEFLASRLAELEDYEIDLILSPVFTPTIHDQAVFAEILGAGSVSEAEQGTVIGALAARPTRALIAIDAGPPSVVTLREVTIERFVRRLRLAGTIPESLLALINHLAPLADRPLLKAVARRAIWEQGNRREIFTRYLRVATTGDDYRRDDALELLKLVETYEPADVTDLVSRIPHWQKMLRHEIDMASNPKPFFNERVQELHGGGRDQRTTDDVRIAARRREAASLERLHRVLSVPES